MLGKVRCEAIFPSSASSVPSSKTQGVEIIEINNWPNLSLKTSRQYEAFLIENYKKEGVE